MVWTVWERLAPLLLLAVLIVYARVSAIHLQRKRQRDEALRLRTALRITLRSLRGLYECNLQSLVSPEPRLTSARNLQGLIRAQMGKLLVLEEREIEIVMNTSVAVELAETCMAVDGRAHGPVAFSVPRRDLRLRVESALAQACDALRAAEAALGPDQPSDASASVHSAIVKDAEPLGIVRP